MHTQCLRKAPFVAALGLLLALAVPAAAQAHHIKTTASCDLLANVATVQYKVEFVDFSASAKPTTKGTIKLDGTIVKQVPPDQIDWNTEPGTLSGTAPGTPGSTHKVNAYFMWSSGKQMQEVETNPCPTPKHPAIDLTKTGPASATPGETVTYAFAVKNTGDVTLALGDIADDKCAATPVRKAGETDTSFDPGDTFNFTCTYVVPAGVSSVVNNASVCGTYSPPGGGPMKVCDSDDHSFPVTQPPAPPQGGTTPPAGGTTPPAGGTLPKTAASGRARLRGPSGCAKRAFRARVNGRSITSVAFYVDGKLAKRFTANRSSYSIKVKPRRLGFGRHRIVARVKFVAASGTQARDLRLTFRRCAGAQVTPRFTG